MRTIMVFVLLFSGWNISLGGTVVISPRIPYLSSFPCGQCHEKGGTSGSVPFTHSQVKIHHFLEAKKCRTCHNSGSKQLLLPSQKLISFNESSQLCGACHGEKWRDWQWDSHGKSVGSWQGERVRFPCTDCHDAHSPAIPPMRAVSPPKAPERLIPKGGLP